MTKRQQKSVVKHEDKRYPTEMLGISIFILILGDNMNTIKKSQLTELLKENGLDEGFIDRIFHRVKMAKNKDAINQVEKDIQKNRQDKEETKERLRKLFIKTYGSLEKTPKTQLAILDI
jgi:hypothetical protein